MHNLTLLDISKTYGETPALSDVTLTLTGGRVHALMGENGAGKSTLIKLLAGVVSADSLTVCKDGKEFPLSNAQDAFDAGFRFIHQELNIVPQVSVAENILLGRRYPRRFGVAVDWTRVRHSAQQALDFLGATHIDVKALAGSLPAGDKMLIRIAAALVADNDAKADLYVFDEPTAALTNVEAEMIFRVIHTLKCSGAAVLYVSHRMDEVLRVCDDVTVLRDGRLVSTGTVAATNRSEIIRAMTGRGIRNAYPERDASFTDVSVVKVKNVSTATLSALDFELCEGEILGVSGLAESGQSELLRLFMGLEPLLAGEAIFHEDCLPDSPFEAWARGVAYLPRERRSESLMLNMPIRSNVVLPHLGDYGFSSNKREETHQTHRLARKVGLKYLGVEQAVGQLSGGNQQKVVFARALYGKPRLLLLDEPTRGVDVGAKYDIYQLVRNLSAQGCTVILTSTDLPEVLGMCDRILVLQEGRQAHLLERGNLSSADLLSYFYAKQSYS